MGATSFPVRGNVVRLSYDQIADYTGDDNPGTMEENPSFRFYDIMWDEGSAVSIASEGCMEQIPDSFYWKGAIVTHGLRKPGPGPRIIGENVHEEQVIEVQISNKADLDELVQELASRMQVRFHRETVRKLSVSD